MLGLDGRDQHAVGAGVVEHRLDVRRDDGRVDLLGERGRVATGGRRDAADLDAAHRPQVREVLREHVVPEPDQ